MNDAPHGLLGKAYARTFRWLLAIVVAVFVLVMAYAEIVYHPNGIAPL